MGARRHAARAGLSWLLVLGAPAAVPPPAAAVDAAAAPVRVLLLGDSVTQGSTGDWTWRYRLWQHLGGAVDLVGPDHDTDDLDGQPPAYADPAFDTDHAARVGRFAGQGRELVAGLVTDFRPDVVVVGLGVNELLWGEPVGYAADQLTGLVREAQAADPDVDVVLTELTQAAWLRTGPDGGLQAAELDARLPGIAEATTTASSQVVVATAADGFTVADTLDGLHPNAGGEVRIAAAVADALAGLGVGTPYPRPLPVVPAVPVVPPPASVTARPGGALVAWTPVAGATSYEVSVRRRGDESWRFVASVAAGPVRLADLAGGTAYDVRVQAWKRTSAGAVTELVVRPRPGAVTRLRAHRGARGLVVRWRPVSGVRSYRVTWRVVGGPARTRRIAGRSLTLRDLAPRRDVRISVVGRAGRTDGPRRSVWVHAR